MSKLIKEKPQENVNSKLFGIRDYLIVGILMLIFTIMVFVNLGNRFAPQTSFELSPENRDIVLDFGDYINIGELYVYLGNYNDRNITISAFNEVTREWQVLRPDVTVSSVFKWNKVDVNCFGRYFGIVCTDEEASFCEFVFTDDEGQIIYPVNISEYPELFDEQDMMFDTAEPTYMDGTMFDEIYYARTGYEFIHHLPTYETTHPQFGKCIISLGMLLFGNNPFGWRFFSALFGILFIPLMYAFAKALFDNIFAATAVGVLITFEGMHYSLSRICTIDTFVAFFIILSYYFMYRYFMVDSQYRTVHSWEQDKFPPANVYKYLIFAGIAMGCSISTKLTGVYAAVGLAIVFIYHTVKYWPKKQSFRLCLFCVLFFIVIPLVQYTLPYIPAVEKYAQMGITDKSVYFDENGLNIGYGWDGLIARTLRNTNYMINYHKNLVAEHPFMSSAQSWPILYKPLMTANDIVLSVATDNGTEITRSAVNYMGNPAVWWPAIGAVLFTLIFGIIKKDRKAAFLLIAYIAQYIPWFGVNRCIFIYHYYPSLLFSIIMLGYVINELIKWKSGSKKFIIAYLCIVAVMFAIFFPIVSGMPVSQEWGDGLEWFESWVFM